MTDNTAAQGGAAAGQPAAERADAVAAVADSFGGLQRTVRRAKSRLLAVAGDDIDSATQALLLIVGAEGPMRASALASTVQADLSTVSRQVATLVARGLLERQPDQHDGRASLLAVTSAGQAAIDQHEQGRQAFFDEVLAGWSSTEMRQLAQQLERFAAAYEHTHTVVMKDWIREKSGRLAGPRPAENPQSAENIEAQVEEGPRS
jgi:DNA-binding MarR family transcriptional regulator